MEPCPVDHFSDQVQPCTTVNLSQRSATASILQLATAAEQGLGLGRVEGTLSSTRALMSAAAHRVPATVYSLDSWPLLMCDVFSPRLTGLVKCLEIPRKVLWVLSLAVHSFNGRLFPPSLCLAWGWMLGPLGRVRSSHCPLGLIGT